MTTVLDQKRADLVTALRDYDAELAAERQGVRAALDARGDEPLPAAPRVTCRICSPWRWESEKPADAAQPSECSKVCAHGELEAYASGALQFVRHYVGAGNAWSAARWARILTRYGRRLLDLNHPPAPPALETR